MLREDEKVIEQTRRWQRYRRPVGAVCFVLGVAAVGLILYWVHDLRTQSLALLSQLDPSRTPTTQEMEQSFDAARYNMGFSLGFGLASALAAAASLAASGLVWLLTQNRKDRLLLRCWDSQSVGS